MAEKQPKQPPSRGNDQALDSVRAASSADSVPDETGYHFRRAAQSEAADNHGGQRTAPLLLTIREVAQMLGISERHVRALHSGGGLPRPIRLGRAVRWDREDLKAWIQAGAPSRRRWEHEKKAS